MRPFPARYPGRCTECHEGIEVDDEVTYVDDELLHAACAPDEEGTLW